MRTLLVATAGGHVDELLFHADRLGISASDAVWVTTRTAHTESLLRRHEVVWMPKVGSGQLPRAALSVPRAIEVHRRIRPDLVVSTGALFAAPHLLAAGLHRCENWYIDSATRVQGPSSTGRLARRLPRTRLFTQSRGWAPPWEPVPSVFDAFTAVPRDDIGRPPTLSRVTVSLGSERWPFPRAVDRVAGLLPDAEITWQVGATPYVRSGVPLRRWIPADELRAAMRRSDVVVLHAGVGSILAALHEGCIPVILPRRRHASEHVDDHQAELAALLARRGLAVAVDADELTRDHLERAASLRAIRLDAFPDGSG